MTLPEIKADETKTCEACGKTGIKNMGVHNRYCPVKNEKPAAKEDVKEEKKEPLPQLIISDVQPYIGDMVAWYNIPDKEYFLVPYYIGIVNHIPFVLVQCVDGALVPPYAITGFVGMYPENQSFPETKSDDEKFPPFEVEEEKEQIKEEVEQVKKAILPEVIKVAEKPVKKHWWSKTPKAITPDPDRKELMELVEGAINVTG